MRLACNPALGRFRFAVIVTVPLMLTASWAAMEAGCSRSSTDAGPPPRDDAGADASPDADAAGVADADAGADGPSDAGLDSTPDAIADASASEVDAADACVHPEVEEDCDAGWCRIPHGCFVIGSPVGEWGRAKYAENQVRVTLTHDFVIQQLETTQAEWMAVGLKNPSKHHPDVDSCSDCLEPSCPVGNVTWFEAALFANKLSEAASPPLEPCYALAGCTGEPGDGMACETATTAGTDLYACSGFRLPTEAEWEYATRAGTATAFYNGEITPLGQLDTCGPDPNLEEIAWYCHSVGSLHESRSGGQRLPNAWGLYDTAGNVAEWVNDPATGSYGSVPLVDPGGMLSAQKAEFGILRGGHALAWSNLCRSANRSVGSPRYGRGPCGGLRLVRTLF